MALTLEAEQRMRDVGMIAFYENEADDWLATVRETKVFLRGKFPEDAPIRRDDVAKALVPILEVHEAFKDFRNERRLRPKYWIKDFADLLIDQTWEVIVEEENNGQNGA